MKRSNSVPELAGLRLKPPPPLATSSTSSRTTNLHGKRGLSTSNVSLPGDFARPEYSPRRQQSLSSPLPFSRINSPTSRQHRVEQLKKEENIDERKNEKEVKQQLQLNQSWDDFRLEDSEDMHSMELMEVLPPQAPPPPYHHQSFISPSSPLTRMRSRSLTPTSPNSGRTFSYRRSCSPVLRPSTLCLGKRKRDMDSEEMDTSPGVPNKRLQLGFTSPLNNPSPIVSPLMGNSPLHHSFSTSTASRKSSLSHSESTPLSSPSSLNVTNPFAVNYDSGNLEHWQSGGSSASSANHSPAGSSSVLRSDPKNASLDEARLSGHFLSVHSPGIVISDDRKSSMVVHALEFPPEINETPTPLSPKGLQFRHKLFQANLPSPVPRVAHGGGIAVVSSVISPKSSATTTLSISQLSKHSSLQHDKYLSPFDSGAEASLHGHMTRLNSRAKRPHLSVSRLGTARQMLRPEPLRPSLSDHRTVPNSSRLVISSPLVKLAVNTGTWDGGAIAGGAGSSVATVTHPADTEPRLFRKRKESEASNDSREDSLMESDTCSSLEDSIELCGSNKDFDSKAVRSVSL